MGVFGGYEMPLWYRTGAKHEHLSVLVNAGLFDTSHMSVLGVSGPDAFDLLQLCFSKNLSACLGAASTPLTPGRCVYGVFLNPNGHLIDDAIVFRLAEDEFLVVFNAGMGAATSRHLAANTGSQRVRIVDFTDRLGKIDIQGPKAAKALSRVLSDPAMVFEKLTYFSFKGHFDPTSPLSAAVHLHREDGGGRDRCRVEPRIQRQPPAVSRDRGDPHARRAREPRGERVARPVQRGPENVVADPEVRDTGRSEDGDRRGRGRSPHQMATTR